MGGFGASANVRQPADRWDWNGTTFLLIDCPGRYVGVVICPAEFADRHGIRSDRDSNVVRASLVNNVVHGDNGDVYIKGIPYVDQGDKGYCVPASWERYLRYMDVPSDMYFFATAAGTGFGGGTYCQAIRDCLKDYLDNYQTHIVVLNPPVTMALVSKSIDQGYPIMWSCFFTRDIEMDAYNRARIRNKDHWDTYLAQLKLDNTKLPDIKKDEKGGHMRLIIGYNATSNEVGVSDSFMDGKTHWLSLDEVNKEDMGDITVLE